MKLEGVYYYIRVKLSLQLSWVARRRDDQQRTVRLVPLLLLLPSSQKTPFIPLEHISQFQIPRRKTKFQDWTKFERDRTKLNEIEQDWTRLYKIEWDWTRLHSSRIVSTVIHSLKKNSNQSSLVLAESTSSSWNFVFLFRKLHSNIERGMVKQWTTQEFNGKTKF